MRWPEVDLEEERVRSQPGALAVPTEIGWS
jgi:hypothetical protein